MWYRNVLQWRQIVRVNLHHIIFYFHFEPLIGRKKKLWLNLLNLRGGEVPFKWDPVHSPRQRLSTVSIYVPSTAIKNKNVYPPHLWLYCIRSNYVFVKRKYRKRVHFRRNAYAQNENWQYYYARVDNNFFPLFPRFFFFFSFHKATRDKMFVYREEAYIYALFRCNYSLSIDQHCVG